MGRGDPLTDLQGHRRRSQRGPTSPRRTGKEAGPSSLRPMGKEVAELPPLVDPLKGVQKVGVDAGAEEIPIKEVPGKHRESLINRGSPR